MTGYRQSSPLLNRRPGAGLQLCECGSRDGTSGPGPGTHNPIHKKRGKDRFSDAVTRRNGHTNRQHRVNTVEGSFAYLFPKLGKELTLPCIGFRVVLEDSRLPPRKGVHDEAQRVVMELVYVGAYLKINCFRQATLL